MRVLESLSIEPLDLAGFDEFLGYLSDHLSDNGQGDAGYFQPLARSASVFPAERAEAFRKGLQVPLGEPGWRRGWLARSSKRKVLGHIDLRAHPERLTEHRCLLGMGVDRSHRKVGLGRRLIEHAEAWALATSSLEWIDLQVLSVNESAIRLYLRSGFMRIGEIPEMFRIDGEVFSYTSMTKKLARRSANAG